MRWTFRTQWLEENWVKEVDMVPLRVIKHSFLRLQKMCKLNITCFQSPSSFEFGAFPSSDQKPRGSLRHTQFRCARPISNVIMLGPRGPGEILSTTKQCWALPRPPQWCPSAHMMPGLWALSCQLLKPKFKPEIWNKANAPRLCMMKWRLLNWNPRHNLYCWTSC